MVKREGADASLKRKDGPSDAGASRKKEGPSARTLLSASEGTVKFSKIEKERLKRYDRGERNSSKGVGKHGLKLKVHRGEKKINQATQRAAQSEVLLPTTAGYLETESWKERTRSITQEQIAKQVNEQTRRKAYDMRLENYGPYRAQYSTNGRHLLLGGGKGHLAIVDWENATITHQLHVRETVRDATFLRDQTMFAVAQHKNLYIYDGQGTELHCLRNHTPQVNRLGFLRYHWLLATVGAGNARLRYLDVSTGELVADIPTRLGDCDAMALNPWNAVTHLGHRGGVVTMWTPNMHEPVVKMLCHKGPVLAMAVDRSGRYMATSGRDGALKLWDVRTYRPLHGYHTPRPCTDVAISDRGMLAACFGPSVQVFKDALSQRAYGPYMTHLLPASEVATCAFCPYEDVLGVGHSKGFCSMLVPGCGEPNFDSFEVNPYETNAQRREGEVVALLEKLPASTIMLDPTRINVVDRNQEERQREFTAAKEARLAEINAKRKAKNKTRGRSKVGKKLNKKTANIMDEKRQKRMEQLEQERQRRKQRAGPVPGSAEPDGFDPLSRFGGD